MRRYLCFVVLLLLSVGVRAQTNVIKKTAVKSNNYGVTYFLPKTDLIVTAEISKITQKAGHYCKYAQKYLGINDPIMENRVSYTLDNATVVTKGVPDESKSYLVEFRAKTTSPFLYLTEEGLICAVNAEYEKEKTDLPPTDKKTADAPKINVPSVLTEEYFQAGSVGKMAEIAAKQIYRLRESRTDLLTGETENVPKDGAAMKLVLEQLELQEKALIEQFIGYETVEKQSYEVLISPVDEMDKYVLFRFSKHLGVVRPDDLSGIPVYMNLKSLRISEKKTEITDPKELAKLSKSKGNQQGIVYNIPVKASVEILFATETLYSAEHLVAQLGETETLLPEIFEDKKAPVKVYFYPETGGLKQVVQ